MCRIHIKFLLLLLSASLLATPVLAGTSTPTPTPAPVIQFGKTELVYELPDRYVFTVDVKTPYSQPTGAFFTYFYEEDDKVIKPIDVDPDNPDQLVFSISTDDLFVYPFIPISVQWSVTDDLGHFAVSPVENIVGRDPRYDWQELASLNFNIHVYFHDRDQSFGQIILSNAEEAADYLEWNFEVKPDKPIIMVVYNESAEAIGFVDYFTEETGGITNPSRGAIYLVVPNSIGRNNWIAVTTMHEMSHNYFYEAVSGDQDCVVSCPPRWLNEGLAECYTSGGGVIYQEIILLELHKAESIPPLRYLDGEFNVLDDQSYLAYDQASSVVCYLIDTYGYESIDNILAEYRNGSKTEDAFINVLGFGFTQLDREWRTAMGLPPLDEYDFYAKANDLPTRTPTATQIVPTRTPLNTTEVVIGAVSGFTVLGLCCFVLIALLIILLITLSQRRKKATQPAHSPADSDLPPSG